MIIQPVIVGGGGSNEGECCWKKFMLDASIEFSSTSKITVTKTGDGQFTYLKNATSEWVNYAQTPEFIYDSAVTIDVCHTVSDTAYQYWFGFCNLDMGTQTNPWSALKQSVFLEATSSFKPCIAGGSQTTFPALSVGDNVHLHMKSGICSVYVNDTLKYTFTNSFANGDSMRFGVIIYNANANIGSISWIKPIANSVTYVVSDHAGDFPSEGMHTDGYYYSNIDGTAYADMQAALEVLGVAKS